MKFRQILITFIIFTASIQIHFAQETPKAVLIQEFGKACSEELMHDYDFFMTELHNSPSADGYVVFYGNENAEGRNLNYIEFFIMNYPQFRGFDKSRLTLVRGANQSQMKVQFWLVPAGANPPTTEKEFVEQEITQTTLFDKNWADFYTEFGKKHIYANSFYGHQGCEFDPNVESFANKLLSDENLTGYLVTHGNDKKRAEKVGKFAVDDLVKNHKVPRNRLKTIYGGKSKEPQIEFWFVPKNAKPPAINSK